MDTKVAAGGASGGLVAILVWLLSLAGIELDAPTAASIATAVAAVVGWFVRSQSSPG